MLVAAERAERQTLPAEFDIPWIRDYAERRDAIIRAIESPALPHGLRMEMLNQLRANACGSARELVFGPGPETSVAFALARRELARYPSERAVIDLMEQSVSMPPADWVTLGALGRTTGPNVVATVNALSRIYFNPRLASCALISLDQVRFTP